MASSFFVAAQPPTFSPNYGGVIATTGNEDFAIGIYAVNTSQGGSADYLVLNYTWSCPGPPIDTGEFGSDTMIVDSVRYNGIRHLHSRHVHAVWRMGGHSSHRGE